MVQPSLVNKKAQDPSWKSLESATWKLPMVTEPLNLDSVTYRTRFSNLCKSEIVIQDIGKALLPNASINKKALA